MGARVQRIQAPTVLTPAPVARAMSLSLKRPTSLTYEASLANAVSITTV